MKPSFTGTPTEGWKKARECVEEYKKSVSTIAGSDLKEEEGHWWSSFATKLQAHSGKARASPKALVSFSSFCSTSRTPYFFMNNRLCRRLCIDYVTKLRLFYRWSLVEYERPFALCTHARFIPLSNLFHGCSTYCWLRVCFVSSTVIRLIDSPILIEIKFEKKKHLFEKKKNRLLILK